MVHRSCSQTTSVICCCAHKQWVYCSIVYACQNKPQGTKILYLLIKEDSIIQSRLYHESTYHHENKACSIPLGIKNRQKITNPTVLMYDESN